MKFLAVVYAPSCSPSSELDGVAKGMASALAQAHPDANVIVELSGADVFFRAMASAAATADESYDAVLIMSCCTVLAKSALGEMVQALGQQPSLTPWSEEWSKSTSSFRSPRKAVAVVPVGPGLETQAQHVRVGPNSSLQDLAAERAQASGVFTLADVVAPGVVLCTPGAAALISLVPKGLGPLAAHAWALGIQRQGECVVVAEAAVGSDTAPLKPTSEDLLRYHRASRVYRPSTKVVALIKGFRPGLQDPYDGHIPIASWADEVRYLVQSEIPGLGSRTGSVINVPASFGSSKAAWQYGLDRVRQEFGETWVFCLEAGESPKRVDSQLIARLCRHPNPAVSAYEVHVLGAAPGGSLGFARASLRRFERRLFYNDGRPCIRGHKHGEHHGYSHEVSADGVRVSTVAVWDRVPGDPSALEDCRLRLMSMAESAGEVRSPAPTYQAMSDLVPQVIEPMKENSSIGVHMLAYPEEDMADVIGWADVLWGLYRAMAIVWTDDTPAPQEWVDMCVALSLRIGHRPLQDDLADARNAGIKLLEQLNVGWTLFFDPDEWLPNPVEDCRQIALMAMTPQVAAYMFRVLNHSKDGPSVSESIRMAAHLPTVRLRMSGRVHESFSRDLLALEAKAGTPLSVPTAPFMLHHRGMDLEPAERERKLQKYKRLLGLELQDNPDNANAWTSLASQHRHEGEPLEELEALERADHLSAGRSHVIKRQLAAWHVAQAIAYFEASVEPLPARHEYREMVGEAVRSLRGVVPPNYPLASGAVQVRFQEPEQPKPTSAPAGE